MKRPTNRPSSRIAGLVIGAAAGAVVGLIVAVNLVITFGPDQGYESSVGQVFDHSTVLGLAAVAVVVAGPVVGMMIARGAQQTSRRPHH